MIADIILIIISFFVLLIATISDIKTREVPDFLSYFLIFSALGIRLINSVYTQKISYFIFGLIGFFIMFIIGNLMYRLHQWGGGDSKLLMGLGAAFATKPFYIQDSVFPFLFIIFFNILIIGSIYGLIFSLYLALKNKKDFIKNFKIINKNYKKFKILALILAIIFILVSYISFDNSTFFKMNILFGIFLVLLPYLTIATKSIELSSLYKKTPISKLTEGDWVDENLKINNKMIYKKSHEGISKEQISLLKKSKIRFVMVKEGIPFIPPFLLGLIYSLIMGRIIFIFF